MATRLQKKLAKSAIREWHGKFVNYLRLIGQESSSKRYDVALETFFSHFKNKLKPEQILRPDIQDYIIMRKQEGVSSTTVNLELSALASFFDFYIQMTSLPMVNPAKGVKKLKMTERPKRAMALTHVDKVMTAAKDDPYDHLLALLAFTSGCRGEEMVLLDKADFDRENMLLRLPAEKCKGKKKGREIPVREDVMALVESMPNERLFAGWAETPAMLRYRWRRLCWKAEVPATGLHSTRHTYATQMSRAGADIATIRDVLGHASTKTTGGYMRGLGASESRSFLKHLPA